MRALCTWSWLVASLSTAAMLAPHAPLLAAQALVNRLTPAAYLAD